MRKAAFLALLPFACGRAESVVTHAEPSAQPAPLTSAVAPSAEPEPDASNEPWLGGCLPGAEPGCTLEVESIARGAITRAERELAECGTCARAALLKGSLLRSRAALRDALTAAARVELAALLDAGDVVLAAQLVDDVEPDADAGWVKRARRRIADRGGERARATPCRTPHEIGLLVSPQQPRPGVLARVLVAADERLAGASVHVEGSDEASLTLARRDHGGPPYWVAAAVRAPSSGSFEVSLVRGGTPLACRRVAVRAADARSASAAPPAIWPSSRSWSGADEALYSAWLERLFDAPENTTWHGLDAVTRDAERNLLFDHLGLGEDHARGPSLQPDCADAPYFFRAYFAWKTRLPFGWHRCQRSAGQRTCGLFASNADPAGIPLAAASASEASEPEPPPALLEASPPLARAPSALVAPEQSALAPASPAPSALAPASVQATLGSSSSVAGAPSATAAEPEPRAFGRFLRQLQDEVHARTLRTALAGEHTDLYPVPLTRAGLRPGTVFSDPYGHTLTLVRWVAQGSDPGRLLAVDAQPDGTVQIKRFWRGNFLFSRDGTVGGFGFKRFRPIVIGGRGPRPLGNGEVLAALGYGDYTVQQSRLSASDFYGTLERLINPRELPPTLRVRDLVDALAHQASSRVREVSLAEDWKRGHPDRVIDMPEGREMFHASGPWEAYSTPCRDLRLLVGIDVLADLPRQAATDRAGHVDVALERELDALVQRLAGQAELVYERSDGSQQRLSLADLLQRQGGLEMGYNPNDCPERRWGAVEGSAELATCRTRAPAEQIERMERARGWFRHRYSCG